MKKPGGDLNKSKIQGIPVTILTGFLGSGKTTVLNHILTKQKGLKTAVLVNEFGEIGIDNDLIVKTHEDIIELANGCICCTINGELLNAINRALANNKIEYLIIETTGLADPLPVAMTVNSSRDQLRLDSIITLIDAENFDSDILSSQIARSQIIYGDILLINKCDLVNEEKISYINSKVSEIKNDPRILKCIKGDVPLGLLLSVGLFESDLIAKNAHDHGHKLKIEGFTSFSFQCNQPFSLRKFQYFLDNQLPSSVYRAKGILCFEESEITHVFHLSGKRFTLEDSDRNRERKNKVVLIGKDIDHGTLEKQIEACISSNI